MWTKQDVVNQIIQNKPCPKELKKGKAFAPSNIALVKYWGKRIKEINLPLTSSLSISLNNRGTETIIYPSAESHDIIILNNKNYPLDHPFAEKLLDYINLFRPRNELHLHIETKSNIPIAAGLASSASGFAATIQALDQLFEWQLSKQELSILARLGSGSASRSLWQGFVEWQQGYKDSGMDSYGLPLDYQWPELRVGLLIVSTKAKAIGSREGMAMTVKSSLLYETWPKQVTQDLKKVKQAIAEKDFPLLGATAENNALAMHGTMLASIPPVCYFQAETIQLMHKIWQLRQDGLMVYFTQDAGANLKLLFLEKDTEAIVQQFADVEVVEPFSSIISG